MQLQTASQSQQRKHFEFAKLIWNWVSDFDQITHIPQWFTRTCTALHDRMSAGMTTDKRCSHPVEISNWMNCLTWTQTGLITPFGMSLVCHPWIPDMDWIVSSHDSSSADWFVNSSQVSQVSCHVHGAASCITDTKKVLLDEHQLLCDNKACWEGNTMSFCRKKVTCFSWQTQICLCCTC